MSRVYCVGWFDDATDFQRSKAMGTTIDWQRPHTDLKKDFYVSSRTANVKSAVVKIHLAKKNCKRNLFNHLSHWWPLKTHLGRRTINFFGRFSWTQKNARFKSKQQHKNGVFLANKRFWVQKLAVFRRYITRCLSFWSQNNNIFCCFLLTKETWFLSRSLCIIWGEVNLT